MPIASGGQGQEYSVKKPSTHSQQNAMPRRRSADGQGRLAADVAGLNFAVAAGAWPGGAGAALPGSDRVDPGEIGKPGEVGVRCADADAALEFQGAPGT